VLSLLVLLLRPETSLVAQAVEWRLSPAPVISVGDGPGEGHELLHVRDAVLLPAGDLLVMSGGTHDLRLYSSSGEFIRTVGREGEGPGEFKFQQGFRLLKSGNLLVYDSNNLRVTEFDANFEVVGTERVAYSRSAMAPAFGRNRPMTNGMVPIATYEIPFFESASRGEGQYEDDLIVRLFAGTEVQASMRRPRGPVFVARGNSGGVTLPLPMGEFVLFNWGPEHVVLGSSHSTSFDLYDAAGRLVGTAEAEGVPRRANRADMLAFDEKTRARGGGTVRIRGVTVSGGEGPRERYLEAAPRGDRVPLFEEVEVGEDGLLWVREYGLGEDEAKWQILDPEIGRTVAYVRTPASWEFLSATTFHLVVRERDEYDVESVRVYRLIH